LSLDEHDSSDPISRCARRHSNLLFARANSFSFFRGRKTTPPFFTPRRARRCDCRVFSQRPAKVRTELFGRGCRTIPNWPDFRAPRSTRAAVRADARSSRAVTQRRSSATASPRQPTADGFRIAKQQRTPRHGNRPRPLHTRSSLLAPRSSQLRPACHALTLSQPLAQFQQLSLAWPPEKRGQN
jgi:hypothetical protein